jgi:GNAT superfamily N-acetyltransferase
MTIIRALTAADLEVICDHRARMFLEAGRAAPDVQAMAAPFRAWLEPRLCDGRYFGFMAEARGRIVAGVGLMELDWPPHPAHPVESRRGYVLNVFVEPEFRRRKIAKALMDAAESEFRSRGLGYLILHATRQGAPLYESKGWRATSEMSKQIA